jgi:hypothetical protein
MALPGATIGHRSPEQLAWEMMMSRDFQNDKCYLGEGPGDSPQDPDELFFITIPGVSREVYAEEHVIRRGEMGFKW